MQVGICLPGPHGATRWALEQLRLQLPVDVVRFDCEYQFDGVVETIRRVGDYGFAALPIVGWPYRRDDAVPWAREKKHARPLADPEINAFAGRVGEWMAAARPPYVEVLNEPDILGGLSPQAWHWVARATCRVIREASPETTIIVPGEVLKPDKDGATPKRWTALALAGLPDDLYDAIAVHPYRNPSAPDVVARRKFRDRFEEIAWTRSQARGHQVLHTEVGWDAGPEEQARHLVRELDLAAEASVPLTVIYAAVGPPGSGRGDFGIFDDTGTAWAPRPAVAAVREWMERRR